MEPGCRAAGKGRAHSVRTGLSCQLGQLAPPEGLQAGGASWPLVSFLEGLGGGCAHLGAYVQSSILAVAIVYVGWQPLGRI